MGIFEKKWDLEKDRLRVVFDLNERKYVTYYGYNLISYDSLSRKSKKEMNKKNELLYTDLNLLQKEIQNAKDGQRFRKLQSMGYTPESFKCVGTNGSMSKEMKQYLNKLTQEENVLLGIHRIGIDDSIEKINDILTNGLIMSGHLDGAVKSSVTLSNNVAFYANNEEIIEQLMYANQYKNSKGSILIRIPDSDLTGNIYINGNDGSIRLNPKYILGYVPVGPNHYISRLIQVEKQNISTNSSQISYSHSYNQELYNQSEFDYEGDEGPRIGR